MTAERALALLRQRVLAGFMSKIYLDQVMFGLDGTYTWRVGAELARAGWWRDARPIPMDLTSDKLGDWREQLDDFTGNYEALSPEVRLRVDTCIGLSFSVLSVEKKRSAGRGVSDKPSPLSGAGWPTTRTTASITVGLEEQRAAGPVTTPRALS